MFSQHHRWAIHNLQQHPYRHDASEIAYTSAALDTATIGATLDYIIAVLYPRAQEAVDTVGDLPAVGNTINDYRLVRDDGDGNAAAYRWEQREGDVSASWYKVADYDWSSDNIVAAYLDKTQNLLVYKYGMDDYDSSGSALTGDEAGQHIWGGASANTHLTLHANSGDGTGAQTGYVQFADDARPQVDSTYDFGSNTYRWANMFTDSLTSGTMVVTGGSITDSSGAISFGDENLSTTGTSTAASFIAGTLTLTGGSITDSSGAISFGDENLTTTGSITGGQVNADNLRLDGNVLSSTNTDGDITVTPNGTGTVIFSSSATLTGTFGVTGDITVDNLSLNGNTLSATDVNGALNLAANGTGVIDLQSNATTLDITATGTVGVTGEITVDNLSLNGNTISSTDVNGNIVLDPNGTGLISVASTIDADTDNAYALGEAASRFTTLYLSTGISDGTTTISMTTLLSFFDVLTGVADGHAIFWDAGNSKWVSSAPDTEIDHGTVTGLTDDDHTQYALLAGRSGGQTLNGGTDASDSLTLHSTSNATKGNIIAHGDLLPGTDATYDLGSASFQYVDLHMTGQAYGLRAENFADATARGAATATEGRLGWQVDTEELYIGLGASWKQVGTDVYYEEDASNWTGSVSTVTYDVSASVDNAKKMVWQFKDNTNDYEVLAPEIDFPSDTQVRITFGVNLTAGTYTLVGR